MRRLLLTQGILTFLTLALYLSGCSGEFEPFNEVGKLRILAIKAEPPTLMPGETAQLTPLVYEPEGELTQYQWDWCPLRSGSESGFECAISEEELIEAAAEIDPIAAALIPSYDLGTDREVSLEHFLSPAVLEAFCEDGFIDGLPFSQVPECGEYIEISVRLVVADDENTSAALKNVRFALDTSLIPNTNPTIGGVRAKPADLGDDGWQVIEEGSTYPLAASSTYDLEASIEESASETFTPAPTEEVPDPEPKKERLFLTWFVTEGETEFGRTGFTEGILTFSDLIENTYFTPGEPLEINFYLVLQDERGGVDWITRTMEVTEF